jgi:hypothetical protein
MAFVRESENHAKRPTLRGIETPLDRTPRNGARRSERKHRRAEFNIEVRMKSRSNTARTGLRHRYEASLWILLAASLALLIHARGLNYLAEMTVFDWLTRSMPESSESDRIVIVGYDNSDLRRFKSTDVSDRLLARAIEAVAAQEPAVIGMNFLREAHLPPGRDELIQTIRTTSNLYGINNTTLSSSVLAGAIDSVRSDRTGSSASITDANGMVRVMQLGYLHTRTKDVHRSFSMRLAEAYTEAAGKPIALTRQGSLRTADGREYRANDAATGGYIDENPRNFAFLSAHPKNRDFSQGELRPTSRWPLRSGAAAREDRHYRRDRRQHRYPLAQCLERRAADMVGHAAESDRNRSTARRRIGRPGNDPIPAGRMALRLGGAMGGALHRDPDTRHFHLE